MRMFAGLLMIAMALPSAASSAGAKVPARLYRVDGRPVPVSCLEQLIGQEGDTRRRPIDLRTCGNTTLTPKAQTDGSIGYETPDGGYFYYSYVGRSGGMDVLSLQNSGGGSGRFTQLVGVSHSNHLLRWVKDIAGGDRCNGGVSGETVANGVLSFDQAITPYDLVALGRPNAPVKPYRDLEDSAASCIGSVHRVGDDAHWTSVNLTEQDRPDQKGWTDRYAYQPCFNALYRAAVRTHHTVLSRRDVTMFAEMFTTRCLSTR